MVDVHRDDRQRDRCAGRRIELCSDKSHSRIFCTRWNGLEKANSKQDALDDAEYTGGLIELYDSTMAFMKNNTKKGWRKNNDKRVELPEYPERASEDTNYCGSSHSSLLPINAVFSPLFSSSPQNRSNSESRRIKADYCKV